MSLVFPAFKNTHCISITGCGEVKNAGKELLKWMGAQKTLVAAVSIRAEKHFVRVIFGGKSGQHLHIDFARQSMFPKSFKPKPSTTIEGIQKALARFMDLEIEATLTGLFEIKLEELPDGGIIRSLFFQTKTGDVAIKVAGASFSITGAPVDSISWEAVHENNIRVAINSEHLKTKVTEHYLTTALERLDSALNVFVLGRTANEQKK